ncbi:MAG: hypothetical protein M1839_005521 [Geoglossum umbratile]|nr:MAG: hypothetical protein M1839_005521 [Geoglossum umbratile]
MTDIPAAEISEYENVGFVVLRGRVDRVLVQKARDAITEKVKEAQETPMDNMIFATIYWRGDWPPECQTLCEAVEKSVSPMPFSPPGSILQTVSQIGVYQSNKLHLDKLFDEYEISPYF